MLSGTDAGFCRLQIAASLPSLPDRLLKRQIGRRTGRHRIGQLEIGHRRKARKPCEIDLLLRQIVAERYESLLLRLKLHLTARDIELCDHTRAALLLELVEDCLSSVDLRLHGN